MQHQRTGANHCIVGYAHAMGQHSAAAYETAGTYTASAVDGRTGRHMGEIANFAVMLHYCPRIDYAMAPYPCAGVDKGMVQHCCAVGHCGMHRHVCRGCHHRDRTPAGSF